MKRSRETTEFVRPSGSEEQNYWFTVLELGVVVGQPKLGLDKAEVRRSSGFVSMP